MQPPGSTCSECSRSLLACTRRACVERHIVWVCRHCIPRNVHFTCESNVSHTQHTTAKATLLERDTRQNFAFVSCALHHNRQTGRLTTPQIRSDSAPPPGVEGETVGKTTQVQTKIFATTSASTPHARRHEADRVNCGGEKEFACRRWGAGEGGKRRDRSGDDKHRDFVLAC